MATIRNFILILLLSPFSLKAQVDRAKIKTYYSLINKAELAIIDSNYSLARNTYLEAFKQKYPNGKDLYNVMLVAYYLKDSVYAKQYLNELAYKGMRKEMFLDTNRYHSFYQYISADYDSLYNAGSKSNMARLGAELTDIFMADQAVREKSLENPDALTKEDYQAMAHVDSLNIERLSNYIKVNGFPSFEQKGFWDNSALSTAGPIWYVLWHNRPNPTAIDSLVQEAVLDGNFRPDDWACVTMEMNDANKYNYHMKLWRKLPSITKENEKKIDKSRASIYLESLEDYKKKYLSQQETIERIRSEYNPNVYSTDMRYNRIFIFLNAFLVPSKAQLESGFQ